VARESSIEWTATVNPDGTVTKGATWNPVTGCSKVSEGCRNCYALRDWARMSANPNTVYYGRKFTDVMTHPERLDKAAIKRDLLAGKDVPGAVLESGTRVEIR
jgi:protein gp37